MSALEKLKQTTSLSELAILLGYKPKSLSYIIYKIPSENRYIQFSIPKKNGGKRIINAPVEQLKNLQKRLAELLNRCFEEICKKSKLKDTLSHGFRKNRSIITNAKMHVNKRHVFNADLQDFFPSINFGRVRGYFIKNAHFELNEKVATVIAQIACNENGLPQGSPCSPIISNLIGHLLDIRLVSLAKRTKCTYSRYADDLTFSTNSKDFPESIAVRSGHTNEWTAGKAIIKEIEKVGFSLNCSKTSLQHKTVRQITTGLVVNKKVNIKNEYYKLARSMCHSLFQSDKFYIDSKRITPLTIINDLSQVEIMSQPDRFESEIKSSSPENPNGNLNRLEGILSYIYQVKGQHDGRKIGDRRYKPTAVTKLCREFLFYKHFFSLNQPLIICEGKTDIIYLKCALKQLETEYSALIKKSDNGFSFKVSFLNFSKNIQNIFAVSEGTPGLASLMDIYKEHMKPFKGHGKMHPVIMLADNDSGSRDIKKKLSPAESTKPFSNYAENLYVVHIPIRSSGEETAIEDLFDRDTLSKMIEGKSFNRSKIINTKTEYGKIVFAEKVVKPNQSSINFTGFRNTLSSIEDAMKDYYKKLAEMQAVHST